MTRSTDQSGTVRVADAAHGEGRGRGGCSSTALQRIDFHGDSLWAGEIDGKVMVAVKSIIVERFGMSWGSQLNRLKRSEIYAEGVFMMNTPSPGGMQQTVGLALDLLPGFLASIETSRIPDPAIRATVVAYQRECHAVLYQHFFGRGSAEVDPASLPLMEKAKLLREIRLAGGRQAAAPWLERLGLALPHGGRPEVTSSEIDREATERVRLFLAKCTREALGARVQARDIFSACNAFLAASGRPRLNNVRFGRAMAACGVAKERGSRYYYLGREVITPHPLGP